MGSTRRTKGIDVVGTYHMVMNEGSKLGLSLAYNYNKSEVTSYNPAFISTDFIIDVEHLAPQHRGTLSAGLGEGTVLRQLARELLRLVD